MSKYIAFSAPSGAGKTTIVKKLADTYDNLNISISATTRKIRPDEKDGVDYHFLSLSEFKKAINEGRFLEYEEVHGNYYGTLIDRVEEATKQANCILFDIDVNGALSVKGHFPDAILIFIKPPSDEELISRLKNRKSENDAAIQKRLERLKFEYKKAEKFDYIVINDQLDHTIEEIERIIFK